MDLCSFMFAGHWRLSFSGTVCPRKLFVACGVKFSPLILQHNKHSRHISGVHAFISTAVIWPRATYFPRQTGVFRSNCHIHDP